MKPTAILTADIHLREDQPICRTDVFWDTQQRKINWLNWLQKDLGVPIIDAGDLFNKWKSSHYLARWCILNLPEEMITLNGNHDTPYHNITLYEKSILGVLEADQTLQCLFDQVTGLFIGDHSANTFLHPFPWGSELKPLDKKYKREGLRNIAMCHVMTYQGRNPWPGCTALGATALLEQMKGYDLVLTGHNHKTFVVEDKGRLLVNPGSLTRQAVDQIDHKPCVFIWYAENNTVEPVYVPIDDDVISRDHIASVEERETRIDAFVERLSGDFEISLSFEKNLEALFAKNRIRQKVKELVWNACRL